MQDVANGVVEVTDRYDGIVSTSQVTRDQGGARASFELEIPYKHLDAALTDLSGLADVIARTEGGEDITARAVRARKDLARTLDGIREARIELIQADTREERLVIKSRIDSLQATADAEQTALNGVKRQGRFATVGVEVTSDSPGSDDDDGGWTLGDALDDAGRVLEVIGGIALISLAVLLPLSLIAALAAFTISRTRRRAREQGAGQLKRLAPVLRARPDAMHRSAAYAADVCNSRGPRTLARSCAATPLIAPARACAAP